MRRGHRAERGQPREEVKKRGGASWPGAGQGPPATSSVEGSRRGLEVSSWRQKAQEPGPKRS